MLICQVFTVLDKTNNLGIHGVICYDLHQLWEMIGVPFSVEGKNTQVLKTIHKLKICMHVVEYVVHCIPSWHQGKGLNISPKHFWDHVYNILGISLVKQSSWVCMCVRGGEGCSHIFIIINMSKEVCAQTVYCLAYYSVVCY